MPDTASAAAIPPQVLKISERGAAAYTYELAGFFLLRPMLLPLRSHLFAILMIANRVAKRYARRLMGGTIAAQDVASGAKSTDTGT